MAQAILFQIPHEMFADESPRLGFSLPSPLQYGVAMIFLPRNPEIQGACEGILAEAVSSHGLRPLGWRTVPTCNACLGDLARAAEPVIRQLFISGEGLQDEELERRLFVTRKHAEHEVRARFGEAASDFYLPTMSCRTICYKGMFLAPQLFQYYPDLSDERLTTALAVVHQRYSTNTFPSWKLAQPFRMVAHNGEINTLSGNRNRVRAYERTMSCPTLGEGLAGLFPIIEPGGSDSASFDNTMELLVRAGRSAPHALMMMIPEAFGPTSITLAKTSGLSMNITPPSWMPWDGPAAMVFTDGKLVGGTLDRNGLRPCRYVITTDGLVVLASEIGVVGLSARTDSIERASSAGPHVPRRHRTGSHHRRQRDQGGCGSPQAVPPMARAEPHRVARPVPRRRGG